MKSDFYDIYLKFNLQLDENKQWGTAKFSTHLYHTVYDELFNKYKSQPINLLEIGLYHGASAILWNEYFDRGNIFVIDIEKRNAIENIKNTISMDRINIVIGDAYDLDVINKLPKFDIVIDDGPHSLESQIKCIQLYYDKLNSGGIIFIEDVQHNSWCDELKKHVPAGATYQWFDLQPKSGAIDSKIFVVSKP
jgi:cephalosporin hydroxylase